MLDRTVPAKTQIARHRASGLSVLLALPWC